MRVRWMGTAIVGALIVGLMAGCKTRPSASGSDAADAPDLANVACQRHRLEVAPLQSIEQLDPVPPTWQTTLRVRATIKASFVAVGGDTTLLRNAAVKLAASFRERRPG